MKYPKYKSKLNENYILINVNLIIFLIAIGMGLYSSKVHQFPLTNKYHALTLYKIKIFNKFCSVWQL